MKTGDVTGVILAGGKSSRMGSDKAALLVNGKRMITYVADVLGDIFNDVIIVAKDEECFHGLGIRTVTDCIGGRGPLVGIYSALSACSTPYCFVLACDMPCVRPSLVRWMVQSCEGHDVFVPRTGPYLEPLFAIYSKKCMEPIKECLANGDYRVRSVFSQVNTGYADEDSIREIDPHLESFTNVDTREDLSKWLTRAAKCGSGATAGVVSPWLDAAR